MTLKASSEVLANPCELENRRWADGEVVEFKWDLCFARFDEIGVDGNVISHFILLRRNSRKQDRRQGCILLSQNSLPLFAAKTIVPKSSRFFRIADFIDSLLSKFDVLGGFCLGELLLFRATQRARLATGQGGSRTSRSFHRSFGLGLGTIRTVDQQQTGEQEESNLERVHRDDDVTI